MFFSHLENRKHRHGDTAAGRWTFEPSFVVVARRPEQGP